MLPKRVNGSAFIAGGYLPQLRTTTYDNVVAALLTAAVASMTLMLTAIAVWFGEFGRTNSEPTSNTGHSILNPLLGFEPDAEENSNAISLVVESPDVSDEDVSGNEEKNITQLQDSIESVSVPEAIVADLAVPTEASSVGNDLPKEASGSGTNPLGLNFGNKRGHSEIGDRRWLIEHGQASDLRQYARCLEALEIQPCAFFSETRRVVYLSDLTEFKPTVREMSEGQASKENRYFLSWSSDSTSLVQADLDLFRQAGIEASKAKICHFLSAKSEQTLLRLEQEYSGLSDVSQIRRTHFGIRPSADGFEFFVIRQLIR